MSRARTSMRSHASTEDQRPTTMPPQKFYTVLSISTPDPFGFGSAAPARPEPRLLDTPGPGKYNPHPSQEHFESIRGRTNGFTSIVPRKLEFVRGSNNPAPVSYQPQLVNHKIKPRIGTIPNSRRLTCYPDERETSSTPGPGSYSLPSLNHRVVTSVFKSRTERNYLPGPRKEPPRFDGRTFVLRRKDMS